MKIEKMICPYCGAALKIRPGQNETECEYCGSTLLISGYPPRSGPEQAAQTPQDASRNESAQTSQDTSRNKPAQTPQDTAKRHALFPPPGFRSGNIAHMIAAAAGYLFIFYVASQIGGAVDFLFFLAASLSVLDLCTDWTGLYARMKGINSPKPLVRFCMKAVWGTVVFIAWIVLLAVVELVFHL